MKPLFWLVGRLLDWTDDQGGQDLIEYALLVMLIAIIVFVAVQTLGQLLVDLYYSQIPGALQP